MNDAFREITGYKTDIKPETFDLSVLPDAGNIKPQWVTRPDGNVEMDGPLVGKATSFSRAVSGNALWGMIEKDSEKKNKNMRDEEWKSVHGQ